MLAEKLRAATAAASTGAWDLAYAYYAPPAPLSWNVSTVSKIGGVNINAQDTSPQGVFFKPDGLKMYVVGQTNDLVYEYDLSAAWNVNTATFLQSFNVGPQEAAPTGIFFKPDGLKMYIVGTIGDDVNEYNLSTAWNISTASYLQTFSVAGQEINPTDLFFKPDGLKMYIVGITGDDVNEYNLSTAWNVSTASYLQNFSVAAQDTAPQGLFFKSDGLKMYIVGSTNDGVYEYNLSTAWNVSTATYLQTYTFLTLTAPNGIFFEPNGGVFYVTGTYASGTTDAVVRSYTIGGFNIAAQETTPNGIFFKPDGFKMYIVGSLGDDVNEYNLSVAWNIATASFLQTFSVAAQDLAPQDLFFREDGLKMYIVGSTNDNVYEYNLSTAWNVSTASYLQAFSVVAQDTGPTGVFFKPGGLKMYVVGQTNDAVYEYNLSAAWDISTASYLQTFSVAGQDTSPQGVFFKPDGLKMYIIGSTGDSVYEYNLSTAWNVSTASYLQEFSVLIQESAPTGIFFKSNGTKMYIIGTAEDFVYQYSLGV